jgi:hypothetical protein
MNLRLMTLGLVVAASLAACSGGGSSGTAGGPAPPATPSPPAAPVPQELAAFARAGMTEAEDAAPKPLNDVELVSNEDNASEFDAWFQ